MIIYDLLIIAGAIFFLILLLRLRILLAFIFPSTSAQEVDVEPPKSFTDLYASADKELRDLGFENPVWVMMQYTPKDTWPTRLAAVYRHPDESILAWLFPPSNPKIPNRLLSFWSTTLQDGRTVISQAFDPFFEMLQTPSQPARTIEGGSLAEQMTQHRAHRSQYNQPANPDSIRTRGILDLASDGMNRRRDELIAQGRFHADGQGLVRPSLGMALRMFGKMMKLKIPKDPESPIPTGRLVHLSHVMDQIRRMEPGRGVQFGLFGASLALAVGLGTIVWDLQFALILLAVITFHEFGHYIAMRLSGYRNVHMLALPLVGGVTIGFDENPNAARQAWMSLMGPLPGILLGWGLAAFLLINGGITGGSHSWLYMTMVVLLFVNYLNVIPMLPLDGGHVVQSLLPPRWLNIQTTIIAVTSILGILISFVFSFYILAFLAAIQLFGLKHHIYTASALRHILKEGVPPKEKARGVRLSKVFQALETVAGPATRAEGRILQAETILKILDTKPMSWLQRLVIGLVYGALVIVPVTAIILGLTFASGTEKVSQQQHEFANQLAELNRQAATMSLDQLVSALRSQDKKNGLPEPASEEAIQKAELRLGKTLPKTLRSFYLKGNGLPALGLVPLEKIGWPDDLLKKLEGDGTFEIQMITERETTPRKINIQQPGHWLFIGKRGDDLTMLLDVQEPDGIVIMRSFSEHGDYGTGYPNFKAMLAQHWVNMKNSALFEKRLQENKRKRLAELEHADMESMLGRFRPKGLIGIMLNFSMPWPEAASEEQIAAAESQLGRGFPPDLREFYGMHNGLPLLQLLSLDELPQWQRESTAILTKRFPEGIKVRVFAEGGSESQMVVETLTKCIVTGGMSPPMDEGTERMYYPTLLWCPQASDASNRFVNLVKTTGYSSFTDYLRDMASNMPAE